LTNSRRKNAAKSPTLSFLFLPVLVLDIPIFFDTISKKRSLESSASNFVSISIRLAYLSSAVPRGF
jgi:hypothetical protein